jgi:hypothetical protein
MRAVSSYVSAIVTAAMMASASGASAQDNKLSVPNVTVTAPAAPVAPPYVGSRSPYFGRFPIRLRRPALHHATAMFVVSGATTRKIFKK